MRLYIGRTDADLARAEDRAHGLTSNAGGAKCYHVVEVVNPDEEGMLGRIYVTDSAGLDDLDREMADVASVTPLTSYGVDPEELTS